MATVSDLLAANADSKPYWEAAREGRLIFRQCANCGHTQFPPRHVCPKCWSEQSIWVESQGIGRVYSFSIVRRSPTPAHASKVPYVVAMIELEDAPRMMANIVGDDALEVKIGDRVKVVFESVDGSTVPQFCRV